VPKAKGKDARGDPQVERVYAWEHSFTDWGRTSATLDECRTLLRQACDAYDVDVPALKTRSGTYCYYDPSTHTIALLRHTVNRAALLHEVAHHIVGDTAPTAQDHGPTFLGIYMTLLEQAEIAPRSALHASARAAGLTWRKPR
jgi:hypothetical protein